MNFFQELARASALNNAVVVGRGERDGLAYTEFGELLFVHTRKFGWVFESASADDAALAAH